MTAKILRGRVLSFTRKPEAIDDADAYTYIEDGGVAIVDGKVAAVGDYCEITKTAKGDTIDHRPHLILPGLIDPHIHFVQMQVVGSYAAALMEWLNTYTFVEEQRFADPGHAAYIAEAFFDEMIRHGTTTAAAYCSVHPASVNAYFTEAAKRNMLMIGGKCLMDRNCPEPLRDTPKAGYDDTKTLIAKWHGKGRARYAITPRFAITSTPEQMEMIKALTGEHDDCYVQTHLSENHGEIALTAELYPEHKDYTSIYAHYGVLGSKTLMGHAIHLSDSEVGLMVDTGTVAVSCPTSNLFLGSGLYDLEAMTAAGVRSAVATDIGGGTSYSMLQTMDEFYKIQQLNGGRLNPLMSFYLMTLGNAAALSLENEIGRIAPGLDADLVILDARATPAMAIKMDAVDNLVQELFLLQTLGDDRAVAEVYVAGEAAKSVLN